jgi:peptidoglycan-associated lipoprotein
MKKLVMSILLVNLLAACASGPQKDISGSGKIAAEEAARAEQAAKAAAQVAKPVAKSVTPIAAPAPTPAPAPVPVPVVVKPVTPPPSAPVVVDPLYDANSILAKRSVYYPFDISAVQEADKSLLEAHAKYLSTHANSKVRLEGNCDERGSDEYNLALGQRRADSVKKLLVVGGVNEAQIESISLGEEKPKAAGHDEAAWSQNRRTDLNYDIK